MRGARDIPNLSTQIALILYHSRRRTSTRRTINSRRRSANTSRRVSTIRATGSPRPRSPSWTGTSAIASKLFDPFVTGKEQGIGLGLAVAKQAAEAHGGRISWERRDGLTVFTIVLPG